MIPPLEYLLLSIQRALANAVTPELRAVAVELDKQNGKALLYFFYDKEITERLTEIASIVCAEVDLPEYSNYEHVIRLDFPQPIPVHGRLAFLRKEPILPRYVKIDRSYLLQQTRPLSVLSLDMQEALLGKVTPSLRLVTVGVDSDAKLLKFQFVYDGKISEEDSSLANAAIQEASGSFPEYKIDSRIERIDSPEEPSGYGQRAVYLRREIEM